jgi:pimeloyl-ACP methyl ester carboxylesterase
MDEVFTGGALAWAALVLAGLAGVVWQAWAPERALQDLLEPWAAAPSQWWEVGGMKVHVRDEGPRDDPLPLVLLHGTSASLHTWDAWAQELRDTRRVIRLDLPGFGLTGPHPHDDYSMAAYVRLLAALLDSLALPKVVLVGNSLGGQVAWQMALEQTDRVDRLVLIDATGYPLTLSDLPLGFRLASWSFMYPLTRFFLPRSVIDSSVRHVYGDPSRVSPELVDRYLALSLRAGNRRALFYRLRQHDNSNHAEQIRRIRQPTLVLWGMRDRLIPPDHARRFVADIAGSRLCLLDALGHVPHEEDPVASLQAVLPFLAR